MKLTAIIRDTFREALARKTIIGFFAVSTFFLLIALVTALVTDAANLMPGANVQIGTPDGARVLTIADVAIAMQAALTSLLHLAALFLSIFATAGIIPNMLERGSIDLLLSKPVSRLEILAGKYLGGLLIVAANVVYYVAGMFLIMSLDTGFWNWGFLAVILPVTWSFAVLWSAMLPLALASRSSALTIILMYAFLYFIAPLLYSREQFLFQFLTNENLQGAITGLFYILPKPGAMTDLAVALVADRSVDWMPVWTSALFAAAMLALAVWMFRRRDC